MERTTERAKLRRDYVLLQITTVSVTTLLCNKNLFTGSFNPGTGKVYPNVVNRKGKFKPPALLLTLEGKLPASFPSLFYTKSIFKARVFFFTYNFLPALILNIYNAFHLTVPDKLFKGHNIFVICITIDLAKCLSRFPKPVRLFDISL